MHGHDHGEDIEAAAERIAELQFGPLKADRLDGRVLDLIRDAESLCLPAPPHLPDLEIQRIRLGRRHDEEETDDCCLESFHDPLHHSTSTATRLREMGRMALCARIARIV
jgi:hypothetical protein